MVAPIQLSSKRCPYIFLYQVTKRVGKRSSRNLGGNRRKLTGTVLGLPFEKFKRNIKNRIGSNVNGHPIHLISTLCGNQHHPIARPGSIQGSRTWTLQNTSISDVVRVKTRDGIPIVNPVITAYLGDVVQGVCDWHPIHHKQWLVVRTQRGCPPNDHTYR